MGNYFDVYGRFDVALISGLDCEVTDENGINYLDLYGGHGVISIGHAEPRWLKAVQDQAAQLAFYSNAVRLPSQDHYASKLALQSGYPNHQLFMVNSGAEANENALKLASLETGRTKFAAFKGGWHGRTAAALGVTDDAKLYAPFNEKLIDCTWLELNDLSSTSELLHRKETAAIIIEGIQGVGGLDEPTPDFLKALRTLCDETGTLLIFDEIQSGFGRTGHFFAHQNAEGIQGDIVTMAKGMGNGFPLAGLLIHPSIEPKKGSLGTTFGGNPLAVAAAEAVLQVLKKDQLTARAEAIGAYAKTIFEQLSGVLEVKGRGLMLGLRFAEPVAELRAKLLYDHFVFTGGSNDKHLLRVLPPLTVTKQHFDHLYAALQQELSTTRTTTAS
ncbi:MAG: aspartate aminotransferase family protein [Saprospiraceae bacterium]